jgi:hypothetical protein
MTRRTNSLLSLDMFVIIASTYVIQKGIVLKAVKARIYPSIEQQSHLVPAFGCARWVWNQSLATMSPKNWAERSRGRKPLLQWPALILFDFYRLYQ